MFNRAFVQQVQYLLREESGAPTTSSDCVAIPVVAGGVEPPHQTDLPMADESPGGLATPRRCLGRKDPENGPFLRDGL